MWRPLSRTELSLSAKLEMGRGCDVFSLIDWGEWAVVVLALFADELGIDELE